MRLIIKVFILIFSFSLLFLSCQYEAQKRYELELEEEKSLAIEERLKEEEEERLALEERLEKERQEKALQEKYFENYLETGATPYAYCYGGNKSCSEFGCSAIEVTTPSNSDVVVTIKKNDKVYRHAYIRAGSTYSLEFPNGTYQAFFYYGNGWNPDKVIKETDCGTLKGGFVSGEQVSKDDPQSLDNNILKYELILQNHGNFKTQPSNLEEAL